MLCLTVIDLLIYRIIMFIVLLDLLNISCNLKHLSCNFHDLGIKIYQPHSLKGQHQLILLIFLSLYHPILLRQYSKLEAGIRYLWKFCTLNQLVGLVDLFLHSICPNIRKIFASILPSLHDSTIFIIMNITTLLRVSFKVMVIYMLKGNSL